jgi:ketosteroid isomerase-like protein
MKRFSTGKPFPFLVPVLAVAGAFLLLLSSSFPATAAQEGDQAQALLKLDDDWSKAAATKDAALVASFYAEEAIAYPPNEPVAVGKAAAQKVWAAYFAAPGFSISWKTTRAEVAASGDMGFTAGTYEDSFDGPDGKNVHETGKYVCIWKKQQDGSWKAVQDIWNSDAK